MEQCPAVCCRMLQLNEFSSRQVDTSEMPVVPFPEISLWAGKQDKHRRLGMPSAQNSHLNAGPKLRFKVYSMIYACTHTHTHTYIYIYVYTYILVYFLFIISVDLYALPTHIHE